MDTSDLCNGYSFEGKKEDEDLRWDELPIEQRKFEGEHKTEFVIDADSLKGSFGVCEREKNGQFLVREILPGIAELRPYQINTQLESGRSVADEVVALVAVIYDRDDFIFDAWNPDHVFIYLLGPTDKSWFPVTCMEEE